MFPLVPAPIKFERKEGFFKFLKDDSGAIKYDYVRDDSLPPEGCELRARDSKLVMRSCDEAGRFYGEVTLGVMDALTGGTPGEFYISDAPAFGYRGYMLDVARYFFDVDTVLRHIDYMALLKLNVLHLHLTDDQGWRVEIKKYPRLTAVGAFRSRTHVRLYRHGGYYTREQLKQIVAYAHSKHIKVVPEIDFPGHFSAAIAAYPELGCYGEGVKVARNFGVKYDVACVGKDTTLSFMKDVLEELFDIFTDEYYHLGGDEVMYERWKLCPECLELKRRLGCNQWSEVQAWALNELSAFLNEHGKKAIIWNESKITGKADKNLVWQYWQGGLDEKKLAEEINSGRQVIMSPCEPYYLDLPYSINGVRAMEKYKLIPEGTKVDAVDNILGAEFPLWTELVPNARQADKMLFPRLAVGAEIAWRGCCDENVGDGAKSYAPLFIRLGAIVGEKAGAEKKGIAYVLDRIWWERRQLYWGAIGNLIGNMKVRRAAKRKFRQQNQR